MGENQGQRLGLLRARVDEMNAQAVDVRLELVEAIELALLSTPVELVLPVVAELLQIAELRSIVPAGAFELVGKTRA